MVAPANSRGHLFWYWRRFGAVWAGAGFVRSGPASRARLAQLRAPGLVLSALAQLHAPAWVSFARRPGPSPWGRPGPAQVLSVAGRGDVLALAPLAFQDAHQDSVKVASHVVNHFTAATFSDKTYRFI